MPIANHLSASRLPDNMSIHPNKNNKLIQIKYLSYTEMSFLSPS